MNVSIDMQSRRADELNGGDVFVHLGWMWIRGSIHADGTFDAMRLSDGGLTRIGSGTLVGHLPGATLVE